MICDDSVTSLFLTQFSSPAAYRVGIGKKWHRPYYDFNYVCRTGRGLGSELPQSVSGNTSGTDNRGHVIDTTLKLLTAFGISTDGLETYVPPAVSSAYYENADHFLNLLPGDGAGSNIGLNISAGRPSRVWPEDKNEELMRSLLEKYPSSRIIVFSDPRERDRAVALSNSFPGQASPISENLDLLEVSAIISRMKILISPDTSLVHIARSFKVPVVGLYTRFGKNFEMWKPYGQDDGAVISNNDYNIFDISVDSVYDTVVRLMMKDKL
jgi:ADP-heptose:LPS heptosyltransferase